MRQRFCPRQVERRSDPGSLRFGSTRSRIGLIRASSSRTGPARGNADGNARETLRPTPDVSVSRAYIEADTAAR